MSKTMFSFVQRKVSSLRSMQMQHISSRCTMYEIVANFAQNARGFPAFCFAVKWHYWSHVCQTYLIYCSDS